MPLFEKRWQFAAIASEEALVSAAVAHFGYMGYGFAYVYERSSGQLRQFKQLTPLGLGAEVTLEPDAGPSRFLSLAGTLRFDPAANRLTIHAPDWRAEVQFAGDAGPFEAAWSIPTAGAHRTRKRMGEAASGTLWRAGEAVPLAGLGLKDWSRGLLARETSWRWAAGAGTAGGKVIGWNLRTGFDDPSQAENAAWVDGAARPLPAATITPGDTWRVEAGPLQLRFTPAGQHREDLDLGLLASRYVQPWGAFSGSWDGVPLVGHGVVEDHWARW